MPKKSDKSKGEGDEPIADFDKHTGDVEGVTPEQPSEDEPHGHPFQPTSAEPVLVTSQADSGALSQTTREQRKNETYRKITPQEAYEDPEFNPVAAAEPPGHKGGPGAEGGSERQSAGSDAVDDSHDEQGDKLDYNWKKEDEQPSE